MIIQKKPSILHCAVAYVIRVALVSALCLLSASTSLLRAQGDDTIKVNTSLVRLNVGVVDKQGRAITNLARGDFEIYEDGVKQSIQSFEPTVAPFSLVMLLDVSGSTKSYRQNLQLAALRFIDALAPEDRVCVIGFSKKVEVWTKFTTDRAAIAYAIRTADGKGETSLYDALKVALERLSSERDRRKAIVVLTDGLDTQEKEVDRKSVGTAVTTADAISAIKPDESSVLKQILAAADRDGVTVFPLALPTGDPKRLPDPSPLQIALYTAARARIQILADRTGGRLNAINRLEDLSRLYYEVAAELRSLYSVSYQSTSEGAHGKWRVIRIDVAKPELLARAKPGYYSR